MNYIREAIDYLKNYKYLKDAQENLRDRLNELNAALDGYKSINLSGMPGGSPANPDDRICNLIYQRDKTEEQSKANDEAVQAIERILSVLDKGEAELLKLSYSTDMTDYDIATKLDIRRATFYRQRSKAIREFAIMLFGIKVIS